MLEIPSKLFRNMPVWAKAEAFEWYCFPALARQLAAAGLIVRSWNAPKGRKPLPLMRAGTWPGPKVEQWFHALPQETQTKGLHAVRASISVARDRMRAMGRAWENGKSASDASLAGWMRHREELECAAYCWGELPEPLRNSLESLDAVAEEYVSMFEGRRIQDYFLNQLAQTAYADDWWLAYC